MTEKDLRKQNRIRIQQIAAKALDGAARVADTIAKPPAVTAPSLNVARRQAANLFGLFRLCANNVCRRSRCCRGEPLHCLSTTVFMLPASEIERLVLGRKARAAGRRAGKA